MNEDLLNFNGQIFSVEKPLFTSSNRAFRYGDGFFESIIQKNDDLPFFHLHHKRLIFTAQKLKLNLSKEMFSAMFWQEEIQKITHKNPHARIRLSLFRGGKGLYTPEKNAETDFLIEVNFLANEPLFFVEKNIKFGFISSVKKDFSPFSNLKTTNALLYVRAAIEREEKFWGEGIILNRKNAVCEAISANIFLVLDGQMCTPPLSSGCVAGVMRAYIMREAKKLKLPILEKNISTSDFLRADEVFTTNAISGISLIKNQAQHSQSQSLAEKIFVAL